MKIKSILSVLCLFGFLGAAQANESYAVFSTCAKELNGALQEAKAMIAKDFLNNKPQYNIVVGAPYGVGYEYFKVKYTVLSEKPQSFELEFKFWYGSDDQCNRVEFEDFIY